MDRTFGISTSTFRRTLTYLGPAPRLNPWPRTVARLPSSIRQGRMQSRRRMRTAGRKSKRSDSLVSP